MSTLQRPPAPVEKCITVRLPVTDAFRLFTTQLRRWWPVKTHSLLNGEDAGIVFGQAVGEAVAEIDRDGRPHLWGTITEWQPPHSFALTWHPGREAHEATCLRVEFQAVAGGTEVRLRHDGWLARGAVAPQVRDGYDRGWDITLAAYSDHVLSEAS